MKKSVLLLILAMNFFAFGLTTSAKNACPVEVLTFDGGQDEFTAAFMKYVNGSYFTAEVTEAFYDLHVKKATKQKGAAGYLYYATSVEIPDFNTGSIVYRAKDQTATAFFSHSYKESELTEGQISWAMTLKWIREALGPNYTEVVKTSGSDKTHYFYLPNADTRDEKAWHIEVHTYRYESSHNGMSVGFKINAVKK